LTDIFGDGFAYDDDTEVPFGLPVRSFTSFNHAADEAALSRMYGGIHYRSAIEVGVNQGRALANFIVDNLKMVKDEALFLGFQYAYEPNDHRCSCCGPSFVVPFDKSPGLPSPFSGQGLPGDHL